MVDDPETGRLGVKGKFEGIRGRLVGDEQLELELTLGVPPDLFLLAGERNPEDATDGGANRLYVVRYPARTAQGEPRTDAASLLAYLRLPDLPDDTINDRLEAVVATTTDTPVAAITLDRPASMAKCTISSCTPSRRRSRSAGADRRMPPTPAPVLLDEVVRGLARQELRENEGLELALDGLGVAHGKSPFQNQGLYGIYGHPDRVLQPISQ